MVKEARKVAKIIKIWIFIFKAKKIYKHPEKAAK